MSELFKTLEFIDNKKVLGKYAHIVKDEDGYDWAGSSIPVLMNDKASIKQLKQIYIGLDFSGVKLVTKKLINK